MKKTLFIGIDFAKANFVASALLGEDPDPICLPKSFSNDDKGAKSLISWIVKLLPETCSLSDVLVCGEHTGSYSLLLPRRLFDAGIDCWLENAVCIKNGSGRIVREKSDSADATMIAEYARTFYQKRVRLFVPESPVLSELRECNDIRRRLVKEQAGLMCKRHDAEVRLKAKPGSKAIVMNIKILDRQLAYIKEQIAKVDRQMCSLIRADKKLTRINDIIVSINGVGPVTAIALIVLTSGFTTFSSKRSLACFLGIAPFRSESGTSIQNGSHRSRQADSYYSGLLYMVAVSAMSWNPEIALYKERLLKKGKPKLVIINNIKNKLITIIWAMVKNDTLYDPDHHLKVAQQYQTA